MRIFSASNLTDIANAWQRAHIIPHISDGASLSIYLMRTT